MRILLCENDTAAAHAAFISRWRGRKKGLESMRRYRWRDVLRNQGLPAPVVVIRIAGIGWYLKVVNHNDRRRASAKNDVDFLPHRQIVIPMRIEIEEQRAAGQVAQ